MSSIIDSCFLILGFIATLITGQGGWIVLAVLIAMIHRAFSDDWS